MKKIALFVLTVFLPGFAVSQESGPQEMQEPLHHVLYINSYDQRMDWARQVLDGIYHILEPDKNQIVIHIENLDTKRHPLDDEYRAKLLEVFQTKHGNTDFSCVIVSDNNAYDFVGEYYNRLFPAKEGSSPIPVFHCGVNGLHPGNESPPNPNFYGIAEFSFPADTVKLAAELFPVSGNMHFHVINDHLETGKKWDERCRRALAPLSGHYRFLHTRDNPQITSISKLEEYIENIDNRNRDQFILLGVFYQDREGHYVTYEAQTETITKAAMENENPVPVFGLLDFQLEHGIVGGQLIGGRKYGEAVARLAKSYLLDSDQEGILKKLTDKPVRYPKVEDFATIGLDFEVSAPLGLSESDLLAITSNVKNLPPPPQVLKRYVIAATGGFLATVLIIAYLIIERTRRKLVEFNNLYLSPVIGLFQTTVDGKKFLRMSPKTAKMLGYDSVDEAIEKAIPEEFYKDPNGRKNLISEFRKGLAVADFRTILNNKSGKAYPVQMNAVLYPKRGYIEGFVNELPDLKDDDQSTVSDTESQKFRDRVQPDYLPPTISLIMLVVGILLILILTIVGLMTFVDPNIVVTAMVAIVPVFMILIAFVVTMTVKNKGRKEIAEAALDRATK